MGVSSLGIHDGIASGQDFVEKFKDSGPLLNTKIVSQSPSRCQMKLVATLYVSPGNKSKTLISV